MPKPGREGGVRSFLVPDRTGGTVYSYDSEFRQLVGRGSVCYCFLVLDLVYPDGQRGGMGSVDLTQSCRARVTSLFPGPLRPKPSSGAPVYEYNRSVEGPSRSPRPRSRFIWTVRFDDWVRSIRPSRHFWRPDRPGTVRRGFDTSGRSLVHGEWSTWSPRGLSGTVPSPL